MNSSKATYEKLESDLLKIEAATGLYLVDQNVDRENIDRSLIENSDEYFDAMRAAMAQAAGQRAEDAGHNINALIGRVIY